LVGRPAEKKPFRRLGIDGRIILNQSSKKQNGRGMIWINLLQDNDKWQDLVKECMNLWIP